MLPLGSGHHTTHLSTQVFVQHGPAGNTQSEKTFQRQSARKAFERVRHKKYRVHTQPIYINNQVVEKGPHTHAIGFHSLSSLLLVVVFVAAHFWEGSFVWVKPKETFGSRQLKKRWCVLCLGVFEREREPGKNVWILWNNPQKNSYAKGVFVERERLLRKTEDKSQKPFVVLIGFSFIVVVVRGGLFRICDVSFVGGSHSLGNHSKPPRKQNKKGIHVCYHFWKKVIVFVIVSVCERETLVNRETG